MTHTKFKGKEIIDQSIAKSFNSKINDSVVYSFEVKIIIDKTKAEKIVNDEVIKLNESHASVSNFFRTLYMKDQQLDFKKPKQ